MPDDNENTTRSLLYIFIAAALGTGGSTAITKFVPETRHDDMSAAQTREAIQQVRQELLARVQRNEHDIDILQEKVNLALKNDSNCEQRFEYMFKYGENKYPMYRFNDSDGSKKKE